MSTILRTLAPYALAAILGLVLWLLHGTIKHQEITLVAYADTITRQAEQLETLVNQINRQGLELRALLSAQEGFRTALDQRTADIENLKHEDQEFRRWAESALPNTVVRMRERPAITGADGYAQHLRTRNPVPPAGSATPHTRRSDAGE